MKVLVTGGTGFLGLNLIPVLKENGHEIRVLVRDQSPTERLPQDIELVKGNLLQPATLNSALIDIDAVIHLAAKLEGNSEKMKSVNVEGTRSLVNKALEYGVSQFIFSSTIHAHPEIPAPTTGDYVRTKMQAEQHLVSTTPSLDHSIVYPTFIIGPRDNRLARYGYFRIVRSNAVVLPPLYPPNRFNIVHVDDVTNTILHCLENTTKMRHIVSGANMSSVELHRKVASIVEETHVVIPVPELLYRHLIGSIMDRLSDRGLSPISGERFRETTKVGTVPQQYTNRAPVPQSSVEKALDDTYAWYKEMGLL
jgi:nucleoside-diphosphate-sugar epimerase